MKSKVVSGKKYWLFGKYDYLQDAINKAMLLKRKLNGNGGGRFRYHIEEFIDMSIEWLFFPQTKYYLWVNKT